MHPRKIFLAGFMGAGKTTIGKMLAAQLGWQFIDLDDVVEHHERQSIPQLFAESEARFRQAETGALKAVIAEQADTVVGLGGGTLAQVENLKLLRDQRALTIFLEAPLPELLARCSRQHRIRPLLQDPKTTAMLFESRMASYRGATLTFSTSGKTKATLVNQIVSAIKADYFPDATHSNPEQENTREE